MAFKLTKEFRVEISGDDFRRLQTAASWANLYYREQRRTLRPIGEEGGFNTPEAQDVLELCAKLFGHD